VDFVVLFQRACLRKCVFAGWGVSFPFFLLNQPTPCFYFIFYRLDRSINRPGGIGRVTNIHYVTDSNGKTPVIEGLDVKYTVYTGHDFNLDPDLVQPHEELETRGRRRRTTVEPEMMDTENDQPNQQPQQRGRSKNHAAKKPKEDAAPAKKPKSAAAKHAPAKKKTPTKQQPQKVNVRKKKGPQRVFAAIVQAAVSPPTIASLPPKETAIPREIIIDPSNDRESGYSPFYCNTLCSPLGQEGVEGQQVSSASFKKMMLMPSGGTTGKPRKLSGRMHENDKLSSSSSSSSDGDNTKWDDDHREKLQLQIAPRSPGRKLKSNLAATHLAIGRFVIEKNETRVKSPKKKSRLAKAIPIKYNYDSSSSDEDSIVAYDEKPVARVHLSSRTVEAIPLRVCPDVADAATTSTTSEKDSIASNEKAAARGQLSLREVFDNGVKKASQFIGEVVHGAAKLEEITHDNDVPEKVDAGGKTQRLHQFRSFLNEVLLHCDGMMEVTTVADQMREYVTRTQAGGGALTFDYSENEVNDYLAQLCAQNKLMRTEGWIYNI
jgi:hypothetical protein